MVNQKYYGYGTAPSIIRELFAYGLEQAKVLGKDKVYDYSLGNPSIPAPAKVNQHKCTGKRDLHDMRMRACSCISCMRTDNKA